MDTVSSKFLEYRDVPQGVAVPDVHLFGEKDRFRYDLRAEGVRQADEHYRGLLGHEGFRLAVCLATRAVLARCLDLVGVEAPDRM